MTDVTPITSTHVCASCKATISTLNVYEGHTDACMQPEVRMRRLEARVAEIGGFCADIYDTIAKLCAILETKHGISEEPTTQRTGSTSGLGVDWAPPVSVTDHYCAGGQYIYPNCQACNPGRTRADACPAEPARSEAAGPEPTGSEPERSG